MIALKEGDRGIYVSYLQLALNRAGYRIPIDGIFGRRTCQAWGRFSGTNQCEIGEVEWQQLLPYLKGYVNYEIRRGDTLWTIATKFQTNIEPILTANPEIDPIFLRIGRTIIVPLAFDLVTSQVSYSYELTEWIIEGLLIRYPFMQSSEIGRSVMGKPITALQLGIGVRQVFYSASYHANEWITTPVLLKFMEEYAKAYAKERRLGTASSLFLFETFRLFAVPLVNPDGVDLVTGALQEETYRIQTEEIAANYPEIPYPDGWKANIEGIDLNLQFPANWELAREIKYAQGFTSPAPRDYVGLEPIQAPESRAIYEFTLLHAFELILSYHTQGDTIYWKYRDYEPDKSREIAEYFGRVSGYAVAETPYESGNAGYKDWFIQDFNRPGFTIEAGIGINPLPISQFDTIYQDNFGILLGGMTQLL